MKNMETTQSRISTGHRIETATDGAAYWAIATVMRSDSSALSTVKDALNLGSSTIDVAYTGVNSSIDVASQIKSKLVASAQPGVDRVKIQSEVTQLQKQLKSISDSAVFSGQNWLSVDSAAAGFNATKSIVSSYSHDSTGAVAIGTIDVGIGNVKLFDANGQLGILDKVDAGTTKSVFNLDISALTDSAADLTKLTALTKQVDGAIASMTGAAADLGSVKSRVNLQQSFTTSLMKSIDKGIGSLIDADMNEESTRLQSLQVQQQLGVQALSIANQSSQAILSLFRG
jgi:flagellin